MTQTDATDPFASATTQPATPPTQTADATQPEAAPQPPPLLKRTVQVLRGGSESSVTFVVPNPRAATVDLPTGPAVP
jgi:hypothetical protein